MGGLGSESPWSDSLGVGSLLGRDPLSRTWLDSEGTGLDSLGVGSAHATSTRYIIHVPVSIYSDAPSEVSWLSLNLAVSLCLTY